MGSASSASFAFPVFLGPNGFRKPRRFPGFAQVPHVVFSISMAFRGVGADVDRMGFCGVFSFSLPFAPTNSELVFIWSADLPVRRPTGPLSAFLFPPTSGFFHFLCVFSMPGRTWEEARSLYRLFGGGFEGDPLFFLFLYFCDFF